MALGAPIDRLEIRPSLAVLGGADAAGSVYVICDLQPTAVQADERPLHVCYLVDASGSMYSAMMSRDEFQAWKDLAGRRGELTEAVVDGRRRLRPSGQTRREMQERHATPMLRTVEAMRAATSSMRPPDDASVVLFADDAVLAIDGLWSGQVTETVWESMLGTSLRDTIGDGTHLAPGLAIAIQQVEQARQRGARPHILFVSDGLIEDKQDVDAALQELTDEAVPVDCFGLGTTFDEDFLMGLADAVNGHYAYLESADEILQALERGAAGDTELHTRPVVVGLRPCGDALLRAAHQTHPHTIAFTPSEALGEWHLSVPGGIGVGARTTCVATLDAASLPPKGAPLLTHHVADRETRAPIAVHEVPHDHLMEVAPSDGTRQSEAVHAVQAHMLQAEARDAVAGGNNAKAAELFEALARLWERLGQYDLATEVRREGQDVAAGLPLESGRSKRIKLASRVLTSTEPAAGASDTLKCPDCGTSNALGDTHCCLCGAVLEVAGPVRPAPFAPPESAAPASPLSGTAGQPSGLVCPQCSDENPQDAVRCSLCGHLLRQRPPSGVSRPDPTRTSAGTVGNRLSCPQCKAYNPADATSCRECSWPLRHR